MHKTIIIIGVDPGYRNTGIAVLGVTKEKSKLIFRIIGTKLIVTEKDSSKKSISGLMKQIDDYLHINFNLNWCVFDNITGVEFNQALGSAAVCTVRGIILARIMVDGGAIIPLAPQTVKIKVCGKRTATKEELQIWACKTIGGFSESIAEYPKKQQEHLTDAAAIAYTAYFKAKEQGLIKNV